MAEEQGLLNRIRDFLERRLASPDDLKQWVLDARDFHHWARESGLADKVPHEFWHYLSDADIYLREPEYRAKQRAELQVWVDAEVSKP